MQNSEKLCLQWNDFQSNIKSAFGELRNDKDFADVTLACEDGHHVLAHKVILASSSPFFMDILTRNKHPHPLVYMRGIKSDDLEAVVDFLYFGEANVFQENLDAFLALANELKLKGPEGPTEEDKSKDFKSPEKREIEATELKVKQTRANESLFIAKKWTPPHGKLENRNSERQIALTNSTVHVNLSELDDQVKSMMAKSDVNLDSKGQRATICTMCRKEGQWNGIRDHIEANHITGVSHTCHICGKITRTRVKLGHHMKQFHRKPFIFDNFIK